jgi:thiol-disulfide isomerase/thioredoxin
MSAMLDPREISMRKVHSTTTVARAICAFLLLLAAGTAHAADAERQPILHLHEHDAATGHLADSVGPDKLLWQSPAFAMPLEFPVAALRTIHFPVNAHMPQPVGEYGIELAGGDAFFGGLVSLDAQQLVIDTAGLGQLHIDRTVLRRVYRLKAIELIFAGPNGLDGWKVSGSNAAWREDRGHLVSDEIGAVIRRDFGTPALARFEIELSWKTKPDFDLAFGVGEDPKSVLRAFRLDVWDSKIVAWRETEREADVTALARIEPGPGRIHLQIMVDQENGRMLVLSPFGEKLADLRVASGKPQVNGGLQLTNKSGDIRVERLRVGRWNGEAPHAVTAEKARLHLTDGTVTYGQVDSFDPAQKQFLVHTDDGDKQLAENQVQDIVLSPEGKPGDPTQMISALFTAGGRASGTLIKIEEGKIWLQAPGIRESIAAPLDALYALIGHAAEQTTDNAAQLPSREGRLEIDNLALRGALANASDGAPNALNWQPRDAKVGSPLAANVSGRIVYRDRPTPAKSAVRKGGLAAGIAVVNANGAINLAGGAGGAGGGAGGAGGGGGGGGGLKVAALRAAGAAAAPAQARSTGQSDALQPTGGPKPKKGESVLHLRFGDTIPGVVTQIDENGVTFHSTVSDATFIPHAQIQAIELMPDAKSTSIARQKKERLLTVPRMQRDKPPTHLIRSDDGDYLRCRLVSMNETELQVEVRLEAKTLPRVGIARIIWLHPETEKAEQPAGALPGTRVQALQGDGSRLTFYATRFEGSTLSGRSELLGNCHVDVGQIDELLFGTAIEAEAASLVFHQWQLTPALEPLANPDGEGGEGEAAGLDSALVGKQAPDFQLDMLDGTKFVLAENRANVLVLDFWASWCGPCRQAMPQVDKVAREFADQGVKLVAVNLAETPDQVRTALAQLQLDMPVALDRQGRVAEQYGANAIPQTVIIGRDGVVQRLFVGAGNHFDEQLRTALRAVLSPDSKQTQ